MDIRSLRGVLAPSKKYVCLYCRLDYVASTVRRITRYQHTTSQPVQGVTNSLLIDNAFNNLRGNFESDPQISEKDLPPPTLERFSARTDADDRVSD